ncbi:MAG: TrmB family transcriptional regulator [Oscillospiraceae bacterium]
MINESLLNALMSIGFTKNGAKVYAALLEEAPLSGYAIARRSGVTRPRTYDALERLKNSGYVRAVPGNPVMYLPVNIEEITAEQEREEQKNLLHARQTLKQLEHEAPTMDNLICIHGYRLILQSVISDIAAAEKTINIQVKKEEYEILEPYLRAAAGRGIQIRIVCAVEKPEDIMCPFAADAAYVDRFHTSQARAGNRWLTVTVDDTSGFTGIVSRGEESIVVSTHNSTYIAFIASNITNYFVQRDYVELEDASQIYTVENSAYTKFWEDPLQ